MTLTQNYSAIAPGLTAQFVVTGGIAPFTYSVLPNGAGGTIDPSSGIYTAPAQMGMTAQTMTDFVLAIDNAGNQSVAEILIGTPLFLFCDIIQTQLGLPNGRVYLWGSKGHAAH